MPRFAQHGSCLLAMMVLAGCVNVADEATKSPLLSDKVLKLSPSTTVPLEAIAAGVLVFMVIDPLAPNWQVESRALGGQRYAVALTMKRFTSGGDGEAYQVFRREAERLAQQHGSADYTVAAFSEGIESTVPVARRVARGIVELR